MDKELIGFIIDVEEKSLTEEKRLMWFIILLELFIVCVAVMCAFGGHWVSFAVECCLFVLNVFILYSCVNRSRKIKERLRELKREELKMRESEVLG